jgi:peptidoglycan L-alanyl-D-glutamate endopeptidase CwlK
MINSRRIEDLDPRVQPICRAHIAACEAESIELLITSTLRDLAAQDALYRIGRDPGDTRLRVTNAKGGQSWHNFGVAWDVVPLIGGKCVWNDPLLWEKIVAAGESVGAEAGAKWKEFKDQPHFQVKPNGLEMSDAFALFTARGSIFV